MKFLEIISTDMVQAKPVRPERQFTYFAFMWLFVRSRTCRIHAFVRLRSSNLIFAFLAKKYLERYFVEIGPDTKIGKYFGMPHPRCIILANNVVLGEHVHVDNM